MTAAINLVLGAVPGGAELLHCGYQVRRGAGRASGSIDCWLMPRHSLVTQSRASQTRVLRPRPRTLASARTVRLRPARLPTASPPPSCLLRPQSRATHSTAARQPSRVPTRVPSSPDHTLASSPASRAPTPTPTTIRDQLLVRKQEEFVDVAPAQVVFRARPPGREVKGMTGPSLEEAAGAPPPLARAVQGD